MSAAAAARSGLRCLRPRARRGLSCGALSVVSGAERGRCRFLDYDGGDHDP